MSLWLAEKMENVSKQVSKLVGYGGDAEPMAPAEADGFTSPQGKRNRSSESPEERKDARVDFSPVSSDVSLVSSTMSSPSVLGVLSTFASPSARVVECKHQFIGITRNDKVICMYCPTVADASCVDCGCNACKSCSGLLVHAGLGKRGHSVTPPPDGVDIYKGRRMGSGVGGDRGSVNEDMADAMRAGASPERSEPMTEPAVSPRSEAEILQLVKEDLEKVMHEHLARVKSAVVQANNALEERGVSLSAAAKKKLLGDSVRLNEQAVTLLKGLRGEEQGEAGVSSRKEFVTLLDGVQGAVAPSKPGAKFAVGGGADPLFVGDIPKDVDYEVFRALFPEGTQIEDFYGRGKFNFAKISMQDEESHLLDQVLEVRGYKLRLAKWKVVVRGGRRGAVEVTRHVAGRQDPAHRAGDRHNRADAYDAARRGLHGGAGRQDGTRERDGMKLGSQEEVSTREKNSSVVLKNLQWGVREDLLRETFKEAISVKVLLGDDGRSHGMGFLDFKDVATATRVMEASRDMLLNGRAVIFAYSLRKMHQAGDRPRPRQAAAVGQELA